MLSSWSQGHEVAAEKEEKIQLALLLDTSNSMDGLIAQAKTQLWSIVNTFGTAEKGGKTPFVEVALYEYGNDSLNAEKQWIRQVQPFTRDLDEVSERLFGLRTNGGTECCGAVIKKAMEDLKWDDSEKTYKAIFIAGNEPFNQGAIDPGEACRIATKHHVIVNTIHCGDHIVGANTGWKSGALVTNGEYSVINQNKRIVHIDAPQDKLIIELNGRLNQTYVRFGKEGQLGWAKQQAQDKNAESSKEAALQRAACKATHNYYNKNWDLVDACEAKDFDWTKVKDEDLPKEMQGKTLEEKKAYVAGKKAARVKNPKRNSDAQRCSCQACSRRA